MERKWLPKFDCILATSTVDAELARQLGPGSRVYRNYNQTNKRGQPLGDWWGAKAYVWTGEAFKRIWDSVFAEETTEHY